jgi:esterase/lipase
MGNPRIDAFAMMAKDWYRNGLDVALMTLPYHSVRAPDDATFSGDRFAVPHVTLLAEAVREATYEIWLAMRWLKSETDRPVGVLGLSLGGYLASLFAGLCDDADFVVPLVAPVCIGDLAWRFFTKTSHYDDGVLPAFDQQELRAAFRVHSPLAHSLKIDPERALIIGGRGDRIVPPEHPHALFEHWDRPDIHWFSGSHLAPFQRKAVVTAIVSHLQRLEIL